MSKVAFFFAGTGMPAEDIKGAYDKLTFQSDVIRVYFNGCQDKKIGGRSMLLGYLNPDLDVVGDSLLRAFSKEQKVTLNLSTLKKRFGNSIIIEPEEVLNQKVEVEDITLLGFSRGAVTTFAAARTLNTLDIPLSLLAVEPVPGEDLKQALGKHSIHRKNNNLSSCKNIKHADIFLGTYSKHNSPFENKWFRQMAPQLPPNEDCHIYSIPKTRL